jgi:capsular polysaccharide biosynthesis protein
VRGIPGSPRSSLGTCRRREVDRFDVLPDVELIDVPVPVEDRHGTSTRSVQSVIDPRLTVDYTPPTHQPRVAIIPNGHLVTKGGVVLSRQGQLVLETLWDEEHRRRDFDPPRALPPATRLEGRHASIVSLWCDNFFHWLFDALPRLALLVASGVSYDSLIVPDPLTSFHRETLEILGVPMDRVTPFVGEHIEAEELVWPAPAAAIGHPTSYTVAWLRRMLGRGAPRPAARDRRIYLQRAHSRRVSNERAILRMLGSYGFEAVDPSRLSFVDQVELFASTEIAVGPHGAAFANGIFSDSLSVLEFYQPAHVNSSIVSAMSAAGHAHWSLVCKRVPSFKAAKLQNMWVSRAAVELSFEQMGVEP